LTEQRPDLAFVTLPAEFLRPTLLHLRDRAGFTHLVLLTAVDWLEESRFQLTYLLSNRTQACDIGLRVMIDRPASGLATMDSIHDMADGRDLPARTARDVRHRFSRQPAHR